jgi:S-adenosylmethionine:tRNA ribosyltransferase-isomerase
MRSSAKLRSMLLSDYDYALPLQQIAQRPLEDRAASRMLLLDRAFGEYRDSAFSNLAELLRGDELILVNNTRVIPARLLGERLNTVPSSSDHKATANRRVEILLSRQVDEVTWEALVRPGRKMRVGQRIQFGDGELAAEVIAHGDHGERTLRFFSSNTEATVEEHIERLGHIPLPPYIDRADEPADRERYQTIFGSRPGAIAAPTAGLHFTPAILGSIRARGIEVCELTLHVGLGTFQPIRTETLEGHTMHGEAYEIPVATAEKITRAKNAGRRVLAVGTTTVRALEDAAIRAAESGAAEVVCSGRAETHLFITPSFQFRLVDALLTNFHLPRSTLLALVCAFAGREKVLAAYEHAVQGGYRFYSYGDCMLIR